MGAAGGAAGGAAAAAAAAIANAIKASGTIVELNEHDFMQILNKSESPVVIYAQKKVFKPKHQYMTSYKGFCFYMGTNEPVQLSSSYEIITAKKIWVPG